MRKIWKCYIFVMVFALCISILPASAEGLGSIDTGVITPPVQGFTSREAMLYAMSPDHLYPFIYDGTPPSTWRQIDTSDCVVGRLYVYDETTGDVLPIGNQVISTFVATKDYLYFVTPEQAIIQSDYTGTNLENIYLARQGNITMINAFGYDVYFVEDGSRIVILDVVNKRIHAMVPGDSVVSAYMLDTEKLIWYDDSGRGTYYDAVSQTSTVLADESEEAVLISSFVMPEALESIATIQSSNVVNFVGQSDNYNNIAFPLADYPARPGTGYTPPEIRSRFVNGWSLTNQNPNPWVETRYAGAGECDGFAKYAHDTFWHIADWSRTIPSWQTGPNSYTVDYHGEGFDWDTKEEMIDFFEGLSRGSFVRYTSKTDETPGNGTHSYVFDGIDDDGLGTWHYECNQDDNNGVGYQYYTFDLYFCKNQFIYEYVEHRLEAKSIDSTTRHKTACVNCAGYLLQTHTASATYTSHNDTKHRVSFSCCSGYVLKNHVILSGPINRCKVCNWIEEI